MSMFGALGVASCRAAGAAARGLRHPTRGSLLAGRRTSATRNSASSSSALAAAAAELRAPLLRACQSSGQSNSYEASRWPAVFGDWGEVRQQVESASDWPSHPLTAAERLSLAQALTLQASSSLSARHGSGADYGERLCSFFGHLLEPGSLIVPRTDGAVHAAVVAVTGEQFLQAALHEVTALLLNGHVVSLAAPKGPALDAAKYLVKGFPPALVQAVEIGPLATLPATIRSFRTLGPTARELWADKTPSPNFGGFSFGLDGVFKPHGMAVAASPLSLARVDLSVLEKSSRSRYDLSQEASELVAMLPKKVTERGLQEVHDLIDLLWAFRDQLPVGSEGAAQRTVALAPAHKHLLVTVAGSKVSEEVVKAAIISAMSPYQEPVTLHTVGLGAKGLLTGHLNAFCRVVQSGKSGLQWRVIEHKDWAAFLAWLHDEAGAQVMMTHPEPAYLFSTLRNLESEVKRRCAEAGGVAWVNLFMPELMDQLTRWTRVHEGQERLRLRPDAKSPSSVTISP
ncbi:unnamed protein product [Polarella glacialis]|uniref:Uncharacterized protein n=1 Tax=Polarella glacialis TaxID=89957 RepID=A0A813GLH1_POLGL|nr:unnamed protein product [Polarella glacialis]